MPVSVRRSPFNNGDQLSNPPSASLIRTPQARVLAALVPEDPMGYVIDWPIWTRALLAVRAGYTAVSGTVTRALNGIRPGSSSGEPHAGLLDLGYIEEVVLDIDGVNEVNYRITAAGIRAYQEYVAAKGKLPELRDAASCTNHRYKAEDQ